MGTSETPSVLDYQSHVSEVLLVKNASHLLTKSSPAKPFSGHILDMLMPQSMADNLETVEMWRNSGRNVKDLSMPLCLFLPGNVRLCTCSSNRATLEGKDLSNLIFRAQRPQDPARHPSKAPMYWAQCQLDEKRPLGLAIKFLCSWASNNSTWTFKKCCFKANWCKVLCFWLWIDQLNKNSVFTCHATSTEQVKMPPVMPLPPPPSAAAAQWAQHAYTASTQVMGEGWCSGHSHWKLFKVVCE